VFQQLINIVQAITSLIENKTATQLFQQLINAPKKKIATKRDWCKTNSTSDCHNASDFHLHYDCHNASSGKENRVNPTLFGPNETG
jgi:hypothetical protein